MLSRPAMMQVSLSLANVLLRVGVNLYVVLEARHCGSLPRPSAPSTLPHSSIDPCPSARFHLPKITVHGTFPSFWLPLDSWRALCQIPLRRFCEWSHPLCNLCWSVINNYVFCDSQLFKRWNSLTCFPQFNWPVILTKPHLKEMRRFIYNIEKQKLENIPDVPLHLVIDPENATSYSRLESSTFWLHPSL